MRSLRRLVVAGATIIALTAIVPSVSASSHKAFHLEKTCVVATRENHCTVTASSFKTIPVGTVITYTPGANAPHGHHHHQERHRHRPVRSSSLVAT